MTVLQTIFSGVSIVLFPVYTLGARFILPEYETLFREFGAELPWLTRFVLASAAWWWLLVLLPLLALSMRFMKTALPAAVIAVVNTLSSLVFMLAVVFVPLVILALYLPIFQMGNVIAQ